MEWTDLNNFTDAGDINNADVLIVDDDEDCLRMLEAYLTMEGFRVTCAANGNEALVFLRSSPFCLMLTDYNMPGMDGLRLSEEALKAAPGLVIVMISGDPLTQLYPRAVKIGITAVLAKPYNVKKLLNIIRKENERRITRP